MPVDARIRTAVWPEGFEVSGRTVSQDDAGRVARGHVQAMWDGPAAMGPILHVRGMDGRPFAYAVPFARDTEAFSEPAVLLGRIGDLHRELGMAPEGGHWAVPAVVGRLQDEFGRFGTLYVSASRGLGPVLMVTSTLPTYFFMADLATDAVARAADVDPALDDPQLGRLLFAGPHEEFVECRAGRRTLLLDADSMAFVPAAGAPTDAADAEVPAESVWRATRRPARS